MIDLARANEKLREAFAVYAWLAVSGADAGTLRRASREVGRRSRGLRVLAELVASGA